MRLSALSSLLLALSLLFGLFGLGCGRFGFAPKDASVGDIPCFDLPAVIADAPARDLPAAECAGDDDCTDPQRSSCLAGRCVEMAGEAPCYEDADCVVSPAQPRCWMGVCIGEPVSRPLPEELTANTWTKVSETVTGGRTGPLFAFVPRMGRFALSAGARNAKAAEDIHFSTEHLDLETKRYENAYPAGAPASFTPAEGPTQAAPHPPWGFSPFEMIDKEGVARMPFFNSGYGSTSNAYFQWTYVPDRRLIYAFLHNKTLTYDPLTRSWTDLEVKPTPTDHAGSLAVGSRTMLWGAMGYDPIHRELVLVGGTASEEGGSPGTWAFSLKDESWRRLEFGSAPINAQRWRIKEAKLQTRGLVAVLRNRLFATQTASEARRDLMVSAGALERLVSSLADNFDPQKLPLEEREQGQRAAGHLAQAKAAVALVNLGGPLDATTGIARVQAVIGALLWAELALSVEPPARALSQLAYHRGTATLVLFGGDGMDRAYADTWSYDCATRRWTQRYPPLSPSPRAGHAFLTLPKSDKLVLVGGYELGNGHSYGYRDAYQNLSGEVWSYDPALNSWSKLAVSADELPSNAVREVASPWTAAVNEQDVLIWLPSGEGRSTWALAVDPSKLDSLGTTEQGVAAETMLFRGDEDSGYRSYDPAFYDRQPLPAAHVFDGLAASITPNRWVAVTPPQGVSGTGWGSSTFDSQRRQVLYWGGGVSYKGTDVRHYSLATGSWSLSASPDWVLEWTDAYRCPAELSFNNRPMGPLQANQAYAYDPVASEMLVVNNAIWRYDVARREWRFPPLDPPFSPDVMHIAFETTPQGVVVWGQVNFKGALFRYNATRASFDALPMQGPELAVAYCDGAGMAYDRKRDALWLAPAGANTLYRYDLASGNLEQVATTPPAILGGEHALWREQVYLPEADVVLLMRRFGAEGAKVNVAYDPRANRWYSIALPFDDGEEHSFSWQSALMFDAVSGLVLLHNPVSFWALKLDRATAGFVELK
ncbi:MAG: hypothetical protein JRH20_20830 [Deltaproteobacteria bacterium]|nr:hypothetical protein [Deltaproteobacteria bacterium]